MHFSLMKGNNIADNTDSPFFSNSNVCHAKFPANLSQNFRVKSSNQYTQYAQKTKNTSKSCLAGKVTVTHDKAGRLCTG